MYYDKTRVRELTRCPYCGADAGNLCIGTRGLRKSNHMERVNLFRERNR